MQTDAQKSQHYWANNGGSCWARVGRGVQMDAATPNNVGTYSALRGKDTSHLKTWEAMCNLNNVGRSCALPNESNIVALLACEQALLFGRVKRVSRERASERRSPSLARSREARFACPNRRACSHAMALPAWATKEKRNVGSCCLKSFTGFKIWATTLNNTQQHATTGKRL